MLIYYVRHGEPIYSPDSLTEYGKEQAEALVARLTRLGLNKIYASTSNRAIMTAEPTCKALGIEPVLLDFANENHAWNQMDNKIYGSDPNRTWAQRDPEFIRRFYEPEVYALGNKWYESPLFEGTDFKEGMLRVNKGCDEFLESLGYVHDRERQAYKVVRENDEKIGFFAHEGFGKLFLSSILDIPYPQFSTRFEISHSSVTVIYFPPPIEGTDYCRPQILQMSNDSHLFKKDILRKYNNWFDV